MKRTFVALAIAAIVWPVSVIADTYTVDATHSEVSFRIRHFVSQTPGKFTDYTAIFELDPKNLESSSVEFVVQAASIDTDNDDRDKHLRSQDFFWVDTHPTLSFRSTKIRRVGGDKFEVTGVMSIRGVEKTITVPVEFLGFIKDPWGGERAGFESTFTINRKDYGIEWNKALDAGGVILGEDVRVTLNLELVRKQ
jgi:polyisoprenoid-binding protein YceI